MKASNKNKKICLVVQRYGNEVNGGAELQCRQFAERLASLYEVDVITTQAIDYMTWKNEYLNEEEVINGVKVKRFPVIKERNQDEFNNINAKFLQYGLSESEELSWIEAQGPFSPKLVKHIAENKEAYDVFVFFTYLYYPTVIGIKQVAEKSILVPEAHDEPFLNMNIIKENFAIPKAFFYNTIEEKNLINLKFHNGNITSCIGGVGIDLPEDISADRFKKIYNTENYIIYVGRIDEGKNCNELFEFFLKYKKRNKNNLKLVLIGKEILQVPKHKDILSLGFVSDCDKFDAIEGAKTLVLPSTFESLSMVVLEALSLRTPVVVNEKCEVLKGHCLKSNAGLYYNNYFEFEGQINFILEHEEIAENMGINGKNYVSQNYDWDVIIGKLTELIEYVAEKNHKS